MLSEINNLIDVKPGDKMNGCFVGITQSMSMNDGSFVIHHFLSHCLKSSTPVCFVAWIQKVSNDINKLCIHYNIITVHFIHYLNNESYPLKLLVGIYPTVETVDWVKNDDNI
jgi:hypothetical protein